MNSLIFRILNKTPTNVVLQAGTKKVVLKWEEFNDLCTLVDDNPFLAVLKEERIKEYEKHIAYLNPILANKLINSNATIGDLSSDASRMVIINKMNSMKKKEKHENAGEVLHPKVRVAMEKEKKTKWEDLFSSDSTSTLGEMINK